MGNGWKVFNNNLPAVCDDHNDDIHVSCTDVAWNCQPHSGDGCRDVNTQCSVNTGRFYWSVITDDVLLDSRSSYWIKNATHHVLYVIIIIFIFLQSLLKEKETPFTKELDTSNDGDSFLAQKQKEKRERDRLREKDAEQAKGQLRNKLGAGDSKSVEQLRTKKRESSGSTHSLPSRHSAVNIPQFYFPLGQPVGESVDAVQQRIREEFGKIEGNQAQRNQLGPVLHVSNIYAHFIITTLLVRCHYINHNTHHL